MVSLDELEHDPRVIEQVIALLADVSGHASAPAVPPPHAGAPAPRP
jgi:hypothetical protein